MALQGEILDEKTVISGGKDVRTQHQLEIKFQDYFKGIPMKERILSIINPTDLGFVRRRPRANPSFPPAPGASLGQTTPPACNLAEKAPKEIEEIYSAPQEIPNVCFPSSPSSEAQVVSVIEEIQPAPQELLSICSPSSRPSGVQFALVIEEVQSAPQEISSVCFSSSSLSEAQFDPVIEEIQPAPQEILSFCSPSRSSSGVQLISVTEENQSNVYSFSSFLSRVQPAREISTHESSQSDVIISHFINVSPGQRTAKGMERDSSPTESSMVDCNPKSTTFNKSDADTEDPPETEETLNQAKRTDDSRRFLQSEIVHSSDDPRRTNIRLFVCTEAESHRRLEMDGFSHTRRDCSAHHSSDDVARPRTLQDDRHPPLSGKRSPPRKSANIP
jgi:hypothetical protein